MAPTWSWSRRCRSSQRCRVASSAATSASLSIPANEIFRLFGRQFSWQPFDGRPRSSSRMPSRSCSRSARTRAAARRDAGGGDGERVGGADDAGNVLRAGTFLHLLAAAAQQRLKRRGASQEEDTTALGAAELVRREAERIHAKRLTSSPNHPGAWTASVWSRTRWPFAARIRGRLGDLRDGLDGADFVVGEHHAREHRFRAERAFEVVYATRPCGVAAQVRNIEAELLQELSSVQAGMVLDRGGDDMVAGAGAAHRTGDPHQRGVDALCAAAREEDFRGSRAEAGGDRFAGGIQRRLSFAPGGVKSARVAKVVRQRTEASPPARLGEEASWRRGRGKSPT